MSSNDLFRHLERSPARNQRTPITSTQRVYMNHTKRWLRAPRAIGIVCGVGATGLGCFYMAVAGAPTIYLTVNGLALLMGLAAVALVWSSGRVASLPGAAVLLTGAVLLATALFGAPVEGAARWVRIGGLSIQISLVVIPAMLVSFAQRRDLYSTLGVVVAALALAVQPDRAMAGILASAVAVMAAYRLDRWVVSALAGAATGFAATLLRPDTLPAVPYVDQILYTSFEAGMLAGLAVSGGALLLVVPAIVGWRHDPLHREVHTVFGVVWFGAVAAAALGNYPTPLVGYGGSAVLGYALSLSLMPPKRQHAAAGVRDGEAARVKGDRGVPGALKILRHFMAGWATTRP